MAVFKKNVVFWDVTSCVSCQNDVSDERIASIITVTIIGELGTMLAVASSLTHAARFIRVFAGFVQAGQDDHCYSNDLHHRTKILTKSYSLLHKQ
jgi:hypothetical protein